MTLAGIAGHHVFEPVAACNLLASMKAVSDSEDDPPLFFAWCHGCVAGMVHAINNNLIFAAGGLPPPPVPVGFAVPGAEAPALTGDDLKLAVLNFVVGDSGANLINNVGIACTVGQFFQVAQRCEQFQANAWAQAAVSAAGCSPLACLYYPKPGSSSGECLRALAPLVPGVVFH